MWPFKKIMKIKAQEEIQKITPCDASVIDGIDWRQILSEGKTVELVDGCRAKCDGTLEDL